MNNTMSNAFYASPEGNGTISYTLNPANAEQRLVFTPDSTTAVNQLYIKDLYGDSVPPVWVNHAQVAKANITRIGMGYGKELKINWTGTAGPSGLTVEVASQSAHATLAPGAANRALSATMVRAGRLLTIRYSLGRSAPVSIRVFRINGEKIAEVAQGVKSAGTHEVRWNGIGTFSSATLIVEIKAGSVKKSYRVLPLRS